MLNPLCRSLLTLSLALFLTAPARAESGLAGIGGMGGGFKGVGGMDGGFKGVGGMGGGFKGIGGMGGGCSGLGRAGGGMTGQYLNRYTTPGRYGEDNGYNPYARYGENNNYNPNARYGYDDDTAASEYGSRWRNTEVQGRDVPPSPLSTLLGMAVAKHEATQFEQQEAQSNPYPRSSYAAHQLANDVTNTFSRTLMGIFSGQTQTARAYGQPGMYGNPDTMGGFRMYAQ